MSEAKPSNQHLNPYECEKHANQLWTPSGFWTENGHSHERERQGVSHRTLVRAGGRGLWVLTG